MQPELIVRAAAQAERDIGAIAKDLEPATDDEPQPCGARRFQRPDDACETVAVDDAERFDMQQLSFPTFLTVFSLARGSRDDVSEMKPIVL
ncbi:hypothetical protein GGD56_000805 [Rhizobium mongolense]|uniref:Uncharacterized protein n=1 Tax=Rhizobium mongolense TaxID=57676 RepID=A0ABR6IGV9_9HYPH|nr:hypothetical protein [Rhizobium mongolense]